MRRRQSLLYRILVRNRPHVTGDALGPVGSLGSAQQRQHALGLHGPSAKGGVRAVASRFDAGQKLRHWDFAGPIDHQSHSAVIVIGDNQHDRLLEIGIFQGAVGYQHHSCGQFFIGSRGHRADR